MDVDTLLKAMTPDVYQRMSTAVELGKWPDGTPLTPEQRDSALQALMLYQSRHNQDAAHMSVAKGGEMMFKSKAELQREFADDKIGTSGDTEKADSGSIARFPADKF
ncbi:YeaC family protein [Photobacterium aphoticum]|uniref:DUF1315 domain-containing protein n=1 Tax=Photobacterium aphoticum TaxID=754436 RepID=A0A0J1JCN1_9GAMM|nr:DUF1315 family protein [Photobacterium aphoticum]KLU99421.1 hypothetical protein ABT58_17445 [Photobacterium aphoticum]PSU54963.1 DUF1315 domain-containing protein [Photobacterium aphoticum]GHA38318.1 transcriptional regulator [Photobacterium aphoticum]